MEQKLREKKLVEGLDIVDSTTYFVDVCYPCSSKILVDIARQANERRNVLRGMTSYMDMLNQVHRIKIGVKKPIMFNDTFWDPCLILLPCNQFNLEQTDLDMQAGYV